MTKEDKEFFANLITEKKGNSDNVKSMVDWVMRIISTISLAVIMFVGNTVIDLRDKVTVLEVKFEGVQNFTEKPRFTIDDFNQKMIPVHQDVDNIMDKLNKRELWMSQKDDKINKMELLLQQLRSDLDKLDN